MIHSLNNLLDNNQEIDYLVGDGVLLNKPIVPYSGIVCEFLAELSDVLMKSNGAKAYSDVITFSFWCRKANLATLK